MRVLASLVEHVWGVTLHELAHRVCSETGHLVRYLIVDHPDEGILAQALHLCWHTQHVRHASHSLRIIEVKLRVVLALAQCQNAASWVIRSDRAPSRVLEIR